MQFLLLSLFTSVEVLDADLISNELVVSHYDCKHRARVVCCFELGERENNSFVHAHTHTLVCNKKHTHLPADSAVIVLQHGKSRAPQLSTETKNTSQLGCVEIQKKWEY